MIVLAVPVVLSELGWMAQGVVDNIMVGRLGPAAIGAVALGNAVYYTPCLFGIGLLLGLDTLVSQAYGRNDHEDCHRWLAQGVYLACIVTPPLMILVAAASYGFTRFGVNAPGRRPLAAAISAFSIGAHFRFCSTEARAVICRASARSASSPPPTSLPIYSTGSAIGSSSTANSDARRSASMAPPSPPASHASPWPLR